MNLDPLRAAAALSAILTAVSILWALQIQIVWRALESTGHYRLFGRVFRWLTVVAGLTTIGAVMALHLIAVDGPSWMIAWLYYSALGLTIVFAFVVAAYYFFLLRSYDDRKAD